MKKSIVLVTFFNITEILQFYYKLDKPIEKQRRVMYNEIVQIKEENIEN